METNNDQETRMSIQSGGVDYAAALRLYNKYGRGRSMKKLCEDEEYDFLKFCNLAREGQMDMESKPGAASLPGFIEVSSAYNFDDNHCSNLDCTGHTVCLWP